MRRIGSIGSLSNLWRKESKGKSGKRCAELDRTKNPRRENAGFDELKEPRLVFPGSAREEKSADTSGGEQKTPGVTGPEGTRRLCIICGKPSDEMICGACADKVGADAVEKKRWEETGKP